MTRHSFVARVVVVLAVAVVPAACKSSRDEARVTPSTTSTTSTTTTSTTTTTTTIPPTTLLQPVTDGGIVKVANATGIPDVAAALTVELASVGFVTRDPVDAIGSDGNLAESKIYVVPGAEAIAGWVSRMMGGVPIYAMSTPVWIYGGAAKLGDANVLVMLGHDRAGLHLGDMVAAPVATTTTSTTTTTTIVVGPRHGGD